MITIQSTSHVLEIFENFFLEGNQLSSDVFYNQITGYFMVLELINVDPVSGRLQHHYQSFDNYEDAYDYSCYLESIRAESKSELN